MRPAKMLIKNRAVSSINEKYKFISTIDTGGTSKVYKVKRKKDNKIFVVKRICNTNEDTLNKENMLNNENILNNEVAILKKIHHKSIVKYKEKIEWNIIMEYIDGILLYDRIKKYRCQPEYVLSIAKQIIKALVYLKNVHIIHCDIKPENIICLNDNRIKIIDFGFSVICKSGKYVGDILFGTVYYTSPEIINQRKPYTHLVDIWSLGVLIYCAFCGYLPFFSNDKKKICRKILKMDVIFPENDWNNIDLNAKIFIKAALQKKAINRPSAKRLLKYAWLSK